MYASAHKRSAETTSTSTPAVGDATIGFADYTNDGDKGIKALVFDDGTGYAFRTEAPNQINTWKLTFSQEEVTQLRNTFFDHKFFSLPARMRTKPPTEVGATCLLFASADKYHEVKNYAVKGTGFDTIKVSVLSTLKDKIKTSPRVPITDLLYASTRYENTHPLDTPKGRLVRNLISDFCRSLASTQELDYDLAKDHFLGNRYLQDVDPIVETPPAKTSSAKTK